MSAQPDNGPSDGSREAEIEELVVEILDRPEGEHAAGFADLRSRFPDQDEFLRRWEDAARAIRTGVGLPETVSEAATANPIDEPEMIAGYEIQSLLGEGGMGTVYLAEQSEPVQRQVALKVVKLGMDTRQILSRFELERRALAVMNHDAIAKVFDVGQTERGQPFFVMEYAPGKPITRYCDENRLTLTDRIELFQKVCNGVQHAHQKGVIHRDLKPGNLLVVGDAGQHAPKIIDFGLARALDSHLIDHSVHTEHGQFVGTPEYMSPEQAGLDPEGVDTRTDVYSLGVVLYELVSGELPFPSKDLRRAGYSELWRTLREDEPPRPSSRLTTLRDSWTEAAALRRTTAKTLGKLLRGDLDWIILKAMAKEPERRYASASELAQDLDRYLAHEPVEAGPPSTWYRMRKLLRRNRAQFSAAAVVLVALIGGTIGTLIGMFEAQAQSKLANDRADKIATQRDEIARQRDAIQIEATTATMVADFFTDMFEVSNPSEARGNSITAREILDKSAKKIDALRDQPEVRARLLQTMGDVYRSIGLYGQAEPLLTQALKIRRAELGDDHPETLRTIATLGKLAWDREDHETAERFHREALDGRRRTLGDDDLDTLSSMNNYGLVLRDLGELSEAHGWLQRSLDGRRRILGEDDRLTLISLSNMAQMLSVLGKHDEAAPLYRDVLDRRRKTLGDDHPETLISINDVGVQHLRDDEDAEAERHFREALKLGRPVLGDDHREMLTTQGNLAQALMAQRKWGAAEEYCVDSLSRYRRLVGDDDPRTLRAIIRMRDLRGNQGRLEETEPFQREIVAISRRLDGDDHPETLNQLLNHGRILNGIMNQPRAAEPLMREVYEARDRKLGPDHLDTLVARGELAKLLSRIRQFEEALPMLSETVERLRGRVPNGKIGDFLRFKGLCLMHLKRFDEAEQAYLKASELVRDSTVSEVARSLVRLYEDWGKPEKAAAWQKKVKPRRRDE